MKRTKVVGKYVLIAFVFAVLGATVSFGTSTVLADIKSQYPVGMLHWDGSAAAPSSAHYWCDAPYQPALIHVGGQGRYSANYYVCE